ncbi:hypothetical protein GCM10022198_20230 [Klugiella xanthotipulae]|uniref:hypothetical protein n=1 Tax=Klugiella xanthotipulae TaxID=244735 RepID=UPI00147776B1|nr:hypothetical protein [Klugiella xanthotipulae]
MGKGYPLSVPMSGLPSGTAVTAAWLDGDPDRPRNRFASRDDDPDLFGYQCGGWSDGPV